MKGMNVMKRCPYCGEILEDSVKNCSRCGKEVNEIIETELVDEKYDSDTFVKEQVLLKERHERRASNNLILGVISVVLCCCSTIPAVVTLVLSILLFVDMNKMSDEIKNTVEYNKVKNKNIVATILAGIVLLYGLVSMIKLVINLVNLDEAMISSYASQLGL